MTPTASVAVGTLAGSAAGALLWAWLFRAERSGTLSRKGWLLLMLLAGLACRGGLAAKTPAFYAPDERSHFNYARYLAEYRAFPVQAAKTDAETDDWEYYQPPAYYMLLAAPHAFVADVCGAGTALDVRVLRLVSVALWGLAAWGVYRFLMKRSDIDDVGAAALMGIVSLLPAWMSISSSVNNDVAVVALGIAFMLLAMGEPSFRRSALMGLVAGLAMLSKSSAALLAVWAAAYWIIRAVRRESRPGAAFAHLALIALIMAAVWLPWGARNLQVYGSFTAEDVANVRPDASGPATADDVMRWAAGWTSTFWAAAGIYNDLRFYYVGTALSAGLVLAAIWLLWSRRERLMEEVRPQATLLAAGLVALIVNAALAVRFAMLYNQAQGRFFFVLLVPIAFLLAAGLRASADDPRRASLHATGFLLTFALAFTGYTLGSVRFLG